VTIRSIDLQKMRSFGGSQNHAFEELCSHGRSVLSRARLRLSSGLAIKRRKTMPDAFGGQLGYHVVDD
jgi:hypothetical protein